VRHPVVEYKIGSKLNPEIYHQNNVEVEVQVHAFLPMALDGVSAWHYTSLYAHVRSPWYPCRVDPGCLVE